MQRLQSRGQITIPADVRRSAGVSPGDLFIVSVSGPGEIRIRRHKTLSMDEVIARFPLDEHTARRPVREVLVDAEAEQGDLLLDRVFNAGE